MHAWHNKPIRKKEHLRNWCQIRENMQPVPNAGKHVTGAKRRKTSTRQVTINIVVWLVEHACCDQVE